MNTSTVLGLMQADPAANLANNLLTAAGGTVYVVGGAVRDVALGKSPKDVDLMVTGLSGDQIESALRGNGAVNLTGKQFGVYRFRVGENEVEIAMPRMEYGNTNTDFTISPDISVEDDLQRRDFTANAMAVNTSDGSLVDPYNGQDDIRNNTLSTVSPTSFRDDPTRILRALTGISRHGLQPDENTTQMMTDEAHTLNTQPGERVQMELDKILTGSDPAGALRTAEDTGVLDQIMPEVSSTMGFDQRNPHHDLDVGSHLLSALSSMTKMTNDPDLRMAALLHDIGKPDSFWLDPDAPKGGGGHFYKKVMPDGTSKGEDHEELGADYADALLRRLKYSNDRRERIVFLIRNHMFPYFKNLKGARRFLNLCGGDAKIAFDLLKLRAADSSGKHDGTMNAFDTEMIALDTRLVQEALDNSQATTTKDLAINGSDLIRQLGMTPGPEIGRILSELLQVVIENPEENTPETLLELAKGFLARRISRLSSEQVMYHYTPSSNRQSILKRGLDPAFDQTGDEESERGIYLDTSPGWKRYPHQDLWKVNVEGLPLEIDPSDDFASKADDSYADKGTWYVCYQPITPDRLSLVTAKISSDDYSDESYNMMQYGQPTVPEEDHSILDRFKPIKKLFSLPQVPQESDTQAARQQALLDALPDYKWSWDGTHLDVWPTKSFAAQDHFERTGHGFMKLAQGRIYIDADGYLDLFVWESRGTEQSRDRAVEAVEEWMMHNLGRESDIVTYEKEAYFEDNWIDAWKNKSREQQWTPDETPEYGSPEYEDGLKSQFNMTDDEWERFQNED